MQISDTFKDLVAEPDQRFKKFFEFYTDVKVSASFGVDRYLRSGREMLRMANIYYKEQDVFHAFVLYSRYVVLFCEKVTLFLFSPDTLFTPCLTQVNHTESG